MKKNKRWVLDSWLGGLNFVVVLEKPLKNLIRFAHYATKLPVAAWSENSFTLSHLMQDIANPLAPVCLRQL